MPWIEAWAGLSASSGWPNSEWKRWLFDFGRLLSFWRQTYLGLTLISWVNYFHLFCAPELFFCFDRSRIEFLHPNSYRDLWSSVGRVAKRGWSVTSRHLTLRFFNFFRSICVWASFAGRRFTVLDPLKWLGNLKIYALLLGPQILFFSNNQITSLVAFFGFRTIYRSWRCLKQGFSMFFLLLE
jgi:hypothetical protein